jgi:NAD(P)-dependent dehydrogenase (short-subunit alcohol dehydrogenase family)
MERQKELDLSGKVAIITGASRGVGRQAALEFAKRGAYVVLAARTVDRDSTLPGTLGDTLDQVEAIGTKAVAVPTDLAKQADLKALVDAAEDEFGGVDILINNAAATQTSLLNKFGGGEVPGNNAATTEGSWNKRFLDLAYEEWLYQFDVNLHAPFTLMQLAVPIMERRGGGRIVNITTGSGEVFRLTEEPVQHDNIHGKNLILPGYFASKRALDRLGSVIAPDLAARNVYVIGLHPGWVATEIVAARLANKSLGDQRPVPTTVPARMMVYFAACENPREYTGRIFWAERELADMNIPLEG